MQGVEILTSERVVIDWDFSWTAFWIVMGVVLLGFLIKGIFKYKRTREIIDIIGFSAIGVFVGAMVSFSVAARCSTPTDYETRYKVTISEEVSMIEFIEHYEVIEQDGKIFTIREKDNNE